MLLFFPTSSSDLPVVFLMGTLVVEPRSENGFVCKEKGSSVSLG